MTEQPTPIRGALAKVAREYSKTIMKRGDDGRLIPNKKGCNPAYITKMYWQGDEKIVALVRKAEKEILKAKSAK